MPGCGVQPLLQKSASQGMGVTEANNIHLGGSAAPHFPPMTV
jgi:hypothetical protein